MWATGTHRMTATEWALLVGLSILWGGSFFFTLVALAALPPFTLVALRVGLAALALNPVLALSGTSLPRERAIWVAFLGIGLLNNAVPFSLIVWGQTQIASGLAAILNATAPLFTVAMAHWTTADERMTGHRLAGVVIGFIGVAVMVGPDALAGLGSTVLAQLAVLGAALSYGAASIFGRRFRRMAVPPLTVATGQVTASTLLILPIALAIDRPWTLTMPGPTVWCAVLGAALLSMALAYIVFFRVLATAGATNISLVTFLIPVSAILLDALVLGERLDPRHGVGMALIAAGLAAIDGRILDRRIWFTGPRAATGHGPDRDRNGAEAARLQRQPASTK